MAVVGVDGRIQYLPAATQAPSLLLTSTPAAALPMPVRSSPLLSTTGLLPFEDLAFLQQQEQLALRRRRQLELLVAAEDPSFPLGSHPDTVAS